MPKNHQCPLNEQRWAPVPGFDNYAASDAGYLVNLVTGNKLDPNPSKDGYVKITLYSTDKRKWTKRLSRVIAESFLGPPPGPLYEADHVNSITSDNRACNLMWVTKKENLKKRDLSEIAKGEDQGHAVLTEEMVKEIRNKYETTNITQAALGLEFGVHQTVISDLLLRKTWKHI